MHSINSFLRKNLSAARPKACQFCKKYGIVIATAILLTITMADALVIGAPSNPGAVEKEGETSGEQLYSPVSSVEIETESIYRVMDADIIPLENMEQVEVEDSKDTDTDTEATEVTEETASAVISYSQEDYSNFLRIVEAEATGGDIMSKMLVADVIINRVQDSRFPNTLTEVIYQGNGEQFQPIADGRFYTVTVTDSTIEAVDRALLGENYSQGAYFFAAVSSIGMWHSSHLTRLFEYGGHVYFTY